jgi:D-arabinose 1-dehydrogenase-like Zn-dependent alcohol dehydrogenase
MWNGYGDDIFTAVYKIRNLKPFASYSRLPLILGRDFCGEVVEVGDGVKDFKPGDKVIGVVPLTSQGAHAEYVLVGEDCVAPKPQSVDAVNASAMIYTFLTVWNTFKWACIKESNAPRLRVLIHGGSGGIGLTAIQLLNAWGVAKIVVTCSSNRLVKEKAIILSLFSKNIVQELGATVFDYNDPNIKEQLTAEGPYDFILDCADTDLAAWSDCLLSTWNKAVHLSLISPVVKNTKRFGIPCGLIWTVGQLMWRNLRVNFLGSLKSNYAFRIFLVAASSSMHSLSQARKRWSI